MAVANPPFCTSDDVAGIWRPLREDEFDRVDNLIAEASAMILDYQAVVTRIESGALSASTLRQVTMRMVHRVLINPSGLRQFSTTVDDATKSGTYDATISTGQLYLTDDEMRRLLGQMTVGGQMGAFTIRPYHEPDVILPVDSWT